MTSDPAECPGAKVLLVDDVPENLDLLYQTLQSEGYTILAAPSGAIALQIVAKASPDLILLDVGMPGMDGFETCRRIKADEPGRTIPIIFITAQHESAQVLEGFRAGAVDFIAKPFQTEEVMARVRTHLKISRLTRALAEKNRELESEIARREEAEADLRTADERCSFLSKCEAERWGLEGFIGKSKVLEKTLSDVRKLQQADSISVLITGESGTGKELIARAIHFGGTRAKGPFIPVNCSAVPKDLAESLFFGHVRGAFSGANTDQRGYFELADKGTLFLDEMGDMPVSLQAKLLRTLEDGFVLPVGSPRTRKVDVRVIAASNADFARKIGDGDFRQDLYFRLARFTVMVPPLRTHPEDIPLLAGHFLRLFAREMGKPPPTLLPETMDLLSRYSFPGNVRELKNAMEGAVLDCEGAPIAPGHLRLFRMPGRGPAPVGQGSDAAQVGEIPLNLEAAEQFLMKRALQITQGNVSRAAELMGINRARIYRSLSQQAGPESPSPRP